MKRKQCPECGAVNFRVTAHVTQDWEVDAEGKFIQCLDECVEVTHRPTEDDLWECLRCGCCAIGSDFDI